MAQPSADRLAMLYRISQTLNSSLNLDEVLTRVMDEVIAAMHAERGFLMLGDDKAQLIFRAARGMDQQTVDAPEFQISRGLVERVAKEGQPRLTSDAQSDAWLGGRASVAGLGLRSILCVPLQLKGATLGVIYVDNRLHAGIFTSDDLDLLSTIASSAAIAIENARLYQVAVEKGRMERELQVAHHVQASLIPAETPQFEGWDFAALWQPARVVGGDFYDFIPMVGAHDRALVGENRREPSAKWHDAPAHGIVIGDVSDKGMPAALFMALTRSIVRACASATQSPADCVGQANRLICADAADGMFVTLFYAQLNPQTNELVYVNAGHNPPLLYSARQGQLIELARTGIALGIDDTRRFEQRSARLEPGDFVVIYTDGFTEATNAQEEEFGLERLRRVILENCSASAKESMQALEHAVYLFAGDAALSDDITAVVVKHS